MREHIKTFRTELLFALGMIVFVIIGFFRIKVGAAFKDESFYIEQAYRFLQGDAFITDDWHIAQFSSILLLPFVWLYKTVVGSFEGVVLAFRMLYLAVHFAVCFFAFLLWRKKDKTFAALSSFVFFLFTPFGIFALSYNTFAINALYLLIPLWVMKRGKIWADVLAGFLFAVAILCNPYLIVLYVIYLLFSLVCLIKGKKEHAVCFLYMTCGAAVLFVLFVIAVLSRASLHSIISNFVNFISDPTHSAKGLKQIIGVFVDFILEIKYISASVAFCFITGLVFRKVRVLMFWAITVLCGVATVYFGFFRLYGNDIGYSAMIIPVSFLGVAAFAYETEKDKYMLIGFCIGLLDALCLATTTNTGIMSPANGISVSSALAFFFVVNYCKEIGKKSGTVLLILVAIPVFVTMIYVCREHVFLEGAREELTEKIQNGPMRGICVTEQEKELYDSAVRNVKSLDLSQTTYIMYYNNNVWLYLLTPELKVGAPSPWQWDRFFLFEDSELVHYFALHPEKTPDTIYIDELSNGWTDEWLLQYADENGYQLIQFENGARALER